jgi:hypothetical protein
VSPNHSDYERRFALVGYSFSDRELLVVHAENHDTIRIISARRVRSGEHENTMRNEDPFTNGRKNPYYKRLGARGRAELLKWSAKASTRTRHQVRRAAKGKT